MTNGDKIRSMSDEELANFLCDLFFSNAEQDCVECPARKTCHTGHTGFIDWLKKDARDDFPRLP